MDKVKLKRLKIEKYRNVAPGTELVFNDGFNVLLGQNGTGKTTLLKLIAMVTASRFGSLKDTEFSISYTLAYSKVSVDVEFKNVRNNSDQLYNEPFSWSYSITLAVEGIPYTWSVRATVKETKIRAGEQPEFNALLPASSPFENHILFGIYISVSLSMDAINGLGYSPLVLKIMNFEEHNATNGRRFDELLGGLDAITGAVNSPDALAASYQFVRPTGRAPTLALDRAKFIPQQLQAVMKNHEPSERGLDGIEVRHEQIDFLANAVKLMGFKGAQMLLRLRKREPVEAGERMTFANFEFTIILDQGTIIPHESLSFGQKRLLAFLYYVAANDDVIIADEIVNGMHYDWIEACLREIGDRQSFLTSQNPLLLDFLPFSSEQDVQRTFILCGKEPGEGRTHMSWKNMSAESAHTFFRSYKTQALQVSEILRSRGWW